MFRNCVAALSLVTCIVVLSTPAYAVVEYDQDVTNEAIFGSGNANGSFTTDRVDGVELGLRGKLRHNASGLAENSFHSNGDGTYTFHSGVAPTQASPTAVWSFEWSINSNYDDTSGFELDFLIYELSMTSTTGASIPTFDPINDVNPGTGTVFWDHSIGTNATGNGAGAEATDETNYISLVSGNNLAQNSWKPHWFAAGFDPTINGEYDFTLSAYLGANLIASTAIQINVVPEPASALLLLGGMLGLMTWRRNR